MKLDDRIVVLGAYSSVCSFCRHWQRRHTCAAFDVIPKAIWRGENNHRAPYPGDGGIQFEPLPENKDDATKVA